MIQRLIQWFTRRREQRATREALLATPGVDTFMVRVMDGRYGKHNWRVKDGMLEAKVETIGGGFWWGPIGPHRDPNTRLWLCDAAERKL